MNETQMKITISAKEQVSQAFNKINKDIQKMQNGIKGLEPTFRKMRNYGAVAFGAITLSMKQAIDTSISFESAFAGVKKTVEATEKQFLQLDKAFKQMTERMPIAYEELSKIAELGGQLGVGVNDIEKFTKTIAMISETTNLTAESAATDFARISNVMSIPIKDMDRMAASLVDLGNNFATTESEVVNFASRIAGSGKIVGMAPSDVMAIATAFSSVGIEAEAGGTAVQKSFLIMDEEINNFSKTGLSAGQKIEQFAKTAGLSAKEFADMWKKHPAEAFSEFTQGLNRLGKDAPAIIDELLGDDVRLKRAFLSLSNAGDLLERAIVKSNKAWKENTAHIIEAEKRFGTTESKIAMFKASVRNLSDSIGDQLKPVLVDIINTIQPMIQSVTAWIEKNPVLAKWIGIISISLAGFITVVGALGLALIPVMAGLSALALLFSPITLAVGVVVGALSVLYFKWEDIKRIMSIVGEKIMEIGSLIVNFFSPIIDSVIFIFKLWLVGMLSIGERITILGQIIWNFLKKILTPLGEFISFLVKHFKIFTGVLSELGRMISEDISEIFDAFTEKISGLIDILKEAWNWIKKVAGKIGNGVSDTWDSVKGGYQEAKRRVNEGLSGYGLNFADGGLVNAPLGTPVTATVHGGEMIIPARDVGSSKGSVVVDMRGSVFLDDKVAEDIGDKILGRLKTEIRF